MDEVEEDMVFMDRRHAGEELGRFLSRKYKEPQLLVLGVARGGVEVAFYVARELRAELGVIVAKKLPFPGHQEYGIGAVAEDYSVYISQEGESRLSPRVLSEIIEEQVREIQERVRKYRQGKGLPDMNGRTVIVVDDGIATGVTLVPVINLCRKKGAAKVVVAAPVSGRQFDEHLLDADAVEVLVQPHPYYAVSQAYESFNDFTNAELLELLRRAEADRKGSAEGSK